MSGIVIALLQTTASLLPVTVYNTSFAIRTWSHIYIQRKLLRVVIVADVRIPGLVLP